jgi:hypothetical protein
MSTQELACYAIGDRVALCLYVYVHTHTCIFLLLVLKLFARLYTQPDDTFLSSQVHAQKLRVVQLERETKRLRDDNAQVQVLNP